MQIPPNPQPIKDILRELLGDTLPELRTDTEPEPVTRPKLQKEFPAFGITLSTLVLITAAVGAMLWLTRPKSAAPIASKKPEVARSPLEPQRHAPPKPTLRRSNPLRALQKRQEAQVEHHLRADDWRHNRQTHARLRRALTSLKQTSKRLGDRASVELCDTALARLHPYDS